MDEIDRRILGELQRDAGRSLEELGQAVGLSRNACWRRVRLLEEAGVLRGRRAVIDPASVNLGLMVFISIRIARHDSDGVRKITALAERTPEITGCYRIAGQVDYIVVARLPDVSGYDSVYKKIIDAIEVADISAHFVMEEIKHGDVLPLNHA